MANPAIISGVPFRIATGLSAPAQFGVFAVQNSDSGSDFSAVFTVQGTVTTLTATLEVSQDGGITWTTYKAAANFFNSAVAATSIIVTPLIAGCLYRINASALTGTQDFWVCMN